MEKKTCFTRLGIGSLILFLLLCILPVAASADTIYAIPNGYDPDTYELISRIMTVTTIVEDTDTLFGSRKEVGREINSTENEKTVNWTYKEKDYWEHQLGITAGKKDWFSAQLQGTYGGETERIYDAGTVTYSPHCQLTLYTQEHLRCITYKTLYTYQVLADNGTWIDDEDYEPWEEYSYEQHHYFVGEYVTETLPCEADTNRPVLLSDGTTSYHCKFISCDKLIPAVGPHTCTFAGDDCNARTRCTQCNKYGSILGHSYSVATCTSPKTCIRCGDTIGEPRGHIMGSWRTISVSNCVNHGVEERQCTQCPQKETRPLPLKDHTYVWVNVTNPTCTAAGEKRYVCSYCEYIGQTEAIPKLNHAFIAATCTTPKKCARCGLTEGSALEHNLGSWTTLSVSNCTNHGVQERQCSRCSYKETQALPLAEHTYVWVTASSATCTSAGQRRQICSYCDYVKQTESIPKLGHSMGSWTTLSVSNCTNHGVQERRCSRCSYRETQSLPLAAHTYVWVTASNATCTSAGQRRQICSYCDYVNQTESIPALGHNYSDATCTAPRKCARCGATSGSALGHSFAAATCTTPKKCTRCGTTSGSALGHSYAAANCTTPQKCTRCNVTTGTPLGHNYTAATCTSAKKCTRCGTTSGSALGHSYSAATCTSPKRCSRCGATSGSALGHNYAAATCTSARKCTRCGTTSGSALGHSYAAATCSSPRRCTRCGTTSGTPLGHNYTSATCTSARRCTRCGTTSGSALGHSWGSWVTTRYPTSTSYGTQKRTCSRCGATETRSFR